MFHLTLFPRCFLLSLSNKTGEFCTKMLNCGRSPHDLSQIAEACYQSLFQCSCGRLSDFGKVRFSSCHQTSCRVYLGDYNCGKSLATEEESQHCFCQCFLCTPLVQMNLRSPCCTTQRMNYLLIQLSWYYCSSDVTLFNSVEQH